MGVSGREKGKRWPVGPLLNLLFFIFIYLFQKYQIIVVTLREWYREKTKRKKKDKVFTRRCIREEEEEEEEETVFVSCHG